MKLIKALHAYIIFYQHPKNPKFAYIFVYLGFIWYIQLYRRISPACEIINLAEAFFKDVCQKKIAKINNLTVVPEPH